MKKQIEQVKEFHVVTESSVNEKLKLSALVLRNSLIHEEAAEVNHAFDKLISLLFKKSLIKLVNKNTLLLTSEEQENILSTNSEEVLAELLKELSDLLYVIYGTFVSLGISPELAIDIFDEVHRSNMSKTVNGKVIKNEQGKVLKPTSYTPADVLSILTDFKS